MIHQQSERLDPVLRINAFALVEAIRDLLDEQVKDIAAEQLPGVASADELRDLLTKQITAFFTQTAQQADPLGEAVAATFFNVETDEVSAWIDDEESEEASCA